VKAAAPVFRFYLCQQNNFWTPKLFRDYLVDSKGSISGRDIEYNGEQS